MITTVTLNAAVDKLYLVENVTPNTVMRVKEVYNTAGGKGLNVSKVAALAGEDVTATGFLGGFIGKYVASLLEADGITPCFAEIDSQTRSCINICDLATGCHTEYLEPGAPVTELNLNEFLEIFKNVLPKSSVVTISGSVPEGVPITFYEDIILHCKNSNKPVIVDTSSALLESSVKASPTMIKPNKDELARLIGEDVISMEQIINAAKSLHYGGIKYVAVSLGDDGAILACDDGVFKSNAPKIKAVNTVGCGDAMVAGFAVSISRGLKGMDALRFATAISAANAMEIQTGHINIENLNKLLPQVKIKKIY